MTTYEANPRDVGSFEWGELGRFIAACSRVSHQMSSDQVPHPRPRPFGVTLGGVYAYRSTPRNAHRGPSRHFLAADVPRQPTGQPGPVRFHGVALRLRRTTPASTSAAKDSTFSSARSTRSNSLTLTFLLLSLTLFSS